MKYVRNIWGLVMFSFGLMAWSVFLINNSVIGLVTFDTLGQLVQRLAFWIFVASNFLVIYSQITGEFRKTFHVFAILSFFVLTLGSENISTNANSNDEIFLDVYLILSQMNILFDFYSHNKHFRPQRAHEEQQYSSEAMATLNEAADFVKKNIK